MRTWGAAYPGNIIIIIIMLLRPWSSGWSAKLYYT